MRAICIDRYGPPRTLRVTEVPRPVPGKGRVLVRVHAASVNDWDLGNLQGRAVNRLLIGLLKPRRPLILGCDVAGIVEAVGPDAGRFAPGDAVFGDLCASGFGAFADYVCVPETALAKKPDSMSFDQAAAFPQAGILAWQGLYDSGHIESRRSLLVNGAGGGVGTFAVQMARRHDVEVTAVDAPGKLAMLRQLGARHVIDYTREDFTRDGRRYDLILDTRSTRSPFDLTRALAPGGMYATVGGHMARIIQIALVGRAAGRLHEQRFRVVVQQPNKDLPRLIELFEAGRLRPVIDGRYPLEETSTAFERFRTAEHVGKIIVGMQ